MANESDRVEIKFLDGPLMGLTTQVDPKSDRFLWYDTDRLGECWANVYAPVEGEEGLWRHIRKRHAPGFELPTEDLYEILD